MNARCIEVNNDLASFKFGTSKPKEGKVYRLECVDDHTEQQRKAFHAIVREMYNSGLWSYDTLDFQEFRNYIKRDYGAGFVKVSRKSLGIKNSHLYLPEEIEVLKSFSKYTKKEVADSLDLIIESCVHHGLDSLKFREIMSGMEI